MSYGERAQPSAHGDGRPRMNGWVGFAAVFLLITGLLKIIYGLALIFQDDKAFFASGNVVVGSTTSTGVIVLLVGILATLAGGGLLRNPENDWARILALVFAVFGFIEAFFAFPIYPLWNIIIMIVLCFVIYALTAAPERS